jgi:hypothetical protein
MANNIDELIRRAAMDQSFASSLLAAEKNQRAKLSREYGVPLTEFEASMLEAAEKTQLYGIIAAGRIKLAEMKDGTERNPYRPPAQTRGIRPDRPPMTKGIQPDRPT